MADVLILGGGFGGLAAATELRQRLGGDHRITLVARDDAFYMGFAKIWELLGSRPIADSTRPLERLRNLGVEFEQADIRSIDPATRTVRTSNGTLRADALLVALGAIGNPEHTSQFDGRTSHDLYDGSAIPAAKQALASFTGGTLAISILGGPFKCPPAPLETALLIDEQLRARGVREATRLVVTTMQPSSLPAAGPDASAYVASMFGERDIDLLTGRRVARVDADAQVVHFAAGDHGPGGELSYDLLLGVPQNVPPPVVADSDLAGEGGWIHPDPRTLRTSFERVYAVGDCTHVPTATAALPKAGVFAAGEAVVAAANIAADLTGLPEERFDGHGFCFLELPGERAAYVRGDFLAQPEPDVELTEASSEIFEEKLAFERDRLDAWLPAG